MSTRRLIPSLWFGLTALGVALLSPAAIAQLPESREGHDPAVSLPETVPETAPQALPQTAHGADALEIAPRPSAHPAAEASGTIGNSLIDPSGGVDEAAAPGLEGPDGDRLPTNAEGPGDRELLAQPEAVAEPEDIALPETVIQGDAPPESIAGEDAPATGANDPAASPGESGEPAGPTDAAPPSSDAVDATEVDATETGATETGAAETDGTETEGTETNAAETDGTETDTAETDGTETDAAETAAIEAERQRRLALFAEGDRLFEAGRYAEAEAIYRQAKGPVVLPEDEPTEGEARLTIGAEDEATAPAEPVTDPTLLPLGAQGHWRRYHEGLEMGLDTRIDVPLQLLTQDYPQFIPAHLKYAERLREKEQPEEALLVLERAVALYPNQPLLVQAHIDALVTQEEWLQAAIAARQFALINPDHPAASELATDAEEYQRRFRRRMRSRITRRAIGNVLAGGLGFALTGNLFGPLSALQTSILLLRGEAAVGERAAAQAVEELEIITDAEVVNYVNELGQELAVLGGRSEFDYEFYVVAEDELNAFALPGGKIFINAGAILSTETKAELAGLVAHELSHAVLSHGFQMMTGGNLMANVLRVVPYGGVATNLAVLNYSRSMESQADRLGTRMLAVSPYAADGMARLMATLEAEGGRAPFAWLSSHPDTGKRTRRLNALIEENGYNRYAYEGVEEHQEIQARVRQILIQAGVLLELDESGEPIDPEAQVDPEVEAEENTEVETKTDQPEIESPETNVAEPEAEATPDTPPPASAEPEPAPVR